MSVEPRILFNGACHPKTFSHHGTTVAAIAMGVEESVGRQIYADPNGDVERALPDGFEAFFGHFGESNPYSGANPEAVETQMCDLLDTAARSYKSGALLVSPSNMDVAHVMRDATTVSGLDQKKAHALLQERFGAIGPHQASRQLSEAWGFDGRRDGNTIVLSANGTFDGGQDFAGVRVWIDTAKRAVVAHQYEYATDIFPACGVPQDWMDVGILVPESRLAVTPELKASLVTSLTNELSRNYTPHSDVERQSKQQVQAALEALREI